MFNITFFFFLWFFDITFLIKIFSNIIVRICIHAYKNWCVLLLLKGECSLSDSCWIYWCHKMTNVSTILYYINAKIYHSFHNNLKKKKRAHLPYYCILFSFSFFSRLSQKYHIFEIDSCDFVIRFILSNYAFSLDVLYSCKSQKHKYSSTFYSSQTAEVLMAILPSRPVTTKECNEIQ